jgi:hypothetical protein
MTAIWSPTVKEIVGMVTANELPPPPITWVKVWLSATSGNPTPNPLEFMNGSNTSWIVHTIPPGTTTVTVTAGFVFDSGKKCSLYLVVPTPGA